MVTRHRTQVCLSTFSGVSIVLYRPLNRWLVMPVPGHPGLGIVRRHPRLKCRAGAKVRMARMRPMGAKRNCRRAASPRPACGERSEFARSSRKFRVRGALRESERVERLGPSPRPSPRKSGAREQKARGHLVSAYGDAPGHDDVGRSRTSQVVESTGYSPDCDASRALRGAEIFLEERERAAPGEVGGGLVVARGAGVVVEGVLGAGIDVDGIALVAGLERRVRGRDALVDVFVH